MSKFQVDDAVLERARPVFDALNTMDGPMHIVLKGHLLIEERLVRITERFVFHPEYMEAARLAFAQRVAVARSMSLDEQNNEMWNLVLAINALRNDFAHGLGSEKRVAKTDRVLTLFRALMRSQEPPEASNDPLMRLTLAVALSLGFLESFENEVIRFREWVDTLDYVVNPHRHAGRARQESDVKEE
jgi:hypothetical protein